MACTQPPPLTPDQISAAIDQSAGAAVRGHIERCPDCRSRFEAAQKFEHRLTGAVARWNCPDPQQLADYHLGVVEPPERDRLAAHVAQCLACTAELADLRGFLAAGPALPSKPVPQRPARPLRPWLGDLIAQLLPLTPALALRGEAYAPLLAEAADVLIAMGREPAGADPFTLVGHIAAPDPDVWAGAMVQLFQAGELLSIATVDDVGGFRFEGLSAGTYSIRLAPHRGRSILLPALNLEPEG